MVNKPHPHLNLIIKWAADPQNVKVQYYSKLSNQWIDHPTPSWDERYDWRVKPEVKPDVVRTAQAYFSSLGNYVISPLIAGRLDVDNVEFTFDGETRELKSVRLINSPD